MDNKIYEPYGWWIKKFLNPIEEKYFCLVALALIS